MTAFFRATSSSALASAAVRSRYQELERDCFFFVDFAMPFVHRAVQRLRAVSLPAYCTLLGPYLLGGDLRHDGQKNSHADSPGRLRENYCKGMNRTGNSPLASCLRWASSAWRYLRGTDAGHRDTGRFLSTVAAADTPPGRKSVRLQQPAPTANLILFCLTVAKHDV